MTQHDFESFWGKMTKWLKMTQNDSKNDWKGHKWVKLTINIWKKVKMTRNNQKWPKMTNCHHGGKMTKNDWKWHWKDERYVLKLIWYFNINCSTFKMLKNDETWRWVILKENDKMTENDTKWL